MKNEKRVELAPAVLARLRAAMEAAGLGPTELSIKAGLAPGHIAMVLARTVRSPAATTLSQVSRALGVSLDWLMGDEVYRPPSEPEEAPEPLAEVG